MALGVPFGWQVESASGVPVSGAKIAFKKAGTATNRSPFTDKNLTVPASNPVIADAAGWFNVYLDPSLDYDITVKSADESITYQSLTYSGPGGDSVSAGRYAAAEYDIVADGTTETHVELQAAIDAIWETGGGILELPEGIMVLGAAVYVWQNVFLEGVGAGYNNLYSSTDFAVYGSAFKAKAGLNADMLTFRYRARSGESTPAAPDDVRHQGGMSKVIVWGNRSSDQSPLVRDTNTSGHGIVIEGCSNVELDEVIAVRCAEDGVVVRSYDYGAGAISPNNMVWGDVRALGNYDEGFVLAGGDQQFGTLTAGYNGGDGIQSSCANTSLSRCFAWNNRGAGVRQQGGNYSTYNQVHAYDNYLSGFINSSSEGTVINSFMFLRNGWDTGQTAANRAGILLGSGSLNVVIGNGVSGDDGLYGGPYQQYGLSSSDAANTLTLGGIRYDGNVTGTTTGLTAANVRLHADTSTNRYLHPGFVAEGAIDMDGKNVFDILWLGSGADTAATFSTGVLTVPSTTCSYNTTADNTATDITPAVTAPEYAWLLLRNGTAANTLTLTHNTAKIRCPNASNVSIGPYEAVILRAVNSTNTIWQVYAAAV
jgi:hypothetical protein